jgi:tetratricopeptide (TPR) repeat protein
MRITSQQARALAAALAAVACLNGGCSTTPRATEGGTLPSRTEPLALSSEQQRRAQALAHFSTGVSLELRDGPEAGLDEFLQSLKLDPSNAKLAWHVARIYLARRDYTNAVAVLEPAARTNAASADAWYGLGVAYRTADQTPQAIAAWRQALKIDPKHLGSMRMLLDVFTQQDAAAEVAGIVGPALKQRSNDPDYWTGLGDLLSAVLRQKPSLSSVIDRAAPRQCYEKALAISPGDPDALARAADAYVQSGDYAKAADSYARLLKMRPNNAQVLNLLWRMYARSDQNDKAIATLEALIKRDPVNFEYYNALGDLYAEIEKTDKAIENYQVSLKLNPDQLDLYLRISDGQMRLKQFDAARDTLNTAAKRFPTRYQIPYVLGLWYMMQKDFTNAVSALQQAETLAQDDPDKVTLTSRFYTTFGSAYERAGDPDRAVALLRKAIELDPNNHNACNDLGYMLADKGTNLDESLALIQKAVKMEPDNGAYLDSLGWVLYRLGRYDEALPHLRRAVEILEKEESPDAVVFDHLAEVLLKLGQRDEAIAAWQRAIKAEPDNQDIADKLRKYSANHTAAPTSLAPPPESPAR